MLDLVVGTLNTSTGPIITAAQLEAALRAGSLNAIEDAKARASASYLFVELSLHLDAILRCCEAIDVPIAQAHRLYLHTVAEGMPCVPAWEMKHGANIILSPEFQKGVSEAISEAVARAKP